MRQIDRWESEKKRKRHRKTIIIRKYAFCSCSFFFIFAVFYLYKLIFFPRICCESLKNREYYSNAWINNKKWLELYALIGSNRNFRINLLQQYKILPVYCLIKREFYVFSRYFEKNWSIEGMHERIKRCSNDEMTQSKHRNQETRKEKKERNI